MRTKIYRIFRIIRYFINCIWYYVLFPLGTEEDDFTKSFKQNRKED